MMLEFKRTASRAQDSYGYNIYSLWVDGRKAASCNGGGYDMKGKCLGSWIAATYPDRLRELDIPMTTRNGQPVREYYGLSYHDPNFDPGKAVIGEGCDDRTLGNKGTGKTVAQAEASGESLGLERYQAFYQASSSVPTARHTVPLIDGACGKSSVEKIMAAISLSLEYVPGRQNRKDDIYILHDSEG